jgi:hypothetical protein
MVSLVPSSPDWSSRVLRKAIAASKHGTLCGERIISFIIGSSWHVPVMVGQIAHS